MQFVNDQSCLCLEKLVDDENSSDEENKTPYFIWNDSQSNTKSPKCQLKNKKVAGWASDADKIERICEIQSSIRLAERLYDNSALELVDLNSIMHSSKEYQRSSGSTFWPNESTPISKLL